MQIVTLLHSAQPKLYGVLPVPSAIGLRKQKSYREFHITQWYIQ